MKFANEKASPKRAASIALWSLEPSSQTSGVPGPLGIAITFANGCPAGRLARTKPISSATL